MAANIDTVKRKLWERGYSVKDVSKVQGLGYDLIVDQKHKVKVLTKEEDPETVPKHTVSAIVDDGEITYHLWRDRKCVTETSPLKVFPREKLQE